MFNKIEFKIPIANKILKELAKQFPDKFLFITNEEIYFIYDLFLKNKKIKYLVTNRLRISSDNKKIFVYVNKKGLPKERRESLDKKVVEKIVKYIEDIYPDIIKKIGERKCMN